MIYLSMSIEKKKSFLNLEVLLVPYIGSSLKSLSHQESLVGLSIRSFLFEPRLKAINLTAVNILLLDRIGLFNQHNLCYIRQKTTRIANFQFSFS